MAVVNYSTVGGIVTPTDTAAQAIIPSMLNYAELRIQRDLDLLPSQIVVNTYSLSIGANMLSISSNDLQTIQTVSITSGTSQIPLLPTTKEFIQNAYNDYSYQAAPTYFAVYGGDTGTGGQLYQNIIVAPYPDQAYPVTIIGTQWLQSLYSTANTTGTGTTYISTNFPDLLIYASLIYVTLYQRNFGAVSNDPQMGQTYETQYDILLKSAIEVENRKKFRDAAWSSQSQSPVATPSR